MIDVPSHITGTPCSVYTSGVETSNLLESKLIRFERWNTGKTNAPPPRTILILLPPSST